MSFRCLVGFSLFEHKWFANGVIFFTKEFLNSLLGSASTWDQTLLASLLIYPRCFPRCFSIRMSSEVIFFPNLSWHFDINFGRFFLKWRLYSCTDFLRGWLLKRLHLTVQGLSLVIFAPWWYLGNCCSSFSLEILASLQLLMVFQSDRLMLVDSFFKRKKIH